MPNIPGICQHCGKIHRCENYVYIADGSTGINISNCTFPCPDCGMEAHLLEGTFETADGILKVLQGPDITDAVLQKIKADLDEARSQDLNNEKWVNRLIEKHPCLAQCKDSLSQISPDTMVSLINTIIQLCSP